MTIFKCKMCGGDLNVTENMTICECEYCGTKQTLPKNNDEAIANLFNRANRLRIHSEFDKAEEIYEKKSISMTKRPRHIGEWCFANTVLNMSKTLQRLKEYRLATVPPRK